MTPEEVEASIERLVKAGKLERITIDGEPGVRLVREPAPTQVTRALPDGDTVTDEVNLDRATLFADSNRGVFIPQYFARSVLRACVSGVADKDYEVLEAGPDHEHYWDAWADVLDNAKITDPKQGECYLYQADDDLWVVPVEKEVEKPVETKVVLGHTFRPFDYMDWSAFAGADEGSLIASNCGNGDTILILSPDGTLHEYIQDADGNSACYCWTREEVNIEPGYKGRKY